jgi:hypothetical protein
MVFWKAMLGGRIVSARGGVAAFFWHTQGIAISLLRRREPAGAIHAVSWNRPEAADLAKLYALVAPNSAAVIESYQKAQDVIRQRGK